MRLMRRVDVIVPCYNYGRYLRDCVRSALSQEGCDVRALVIDDHSADDSLVLARAAAAGEPRIELRAHAVNRGHIATYNEGIDWVSAPYMLLLSADDLLAPGAFARAIAVMEANPAVAFVHGRSPRFDDRQGVPAVPPAGEPVLTSVLDGRAYIQAQCNHPVNPVETATAIVRTRCQKQAGHYRASLPHAGDMEMWLRLAAIGDVGFVDGVQAFTRLHDTNMRHAFNSGLMLGDFRQRVETFVRFFAEHAMQVPGAARLEALVRRRLAAEMLWAANRALVRDAAADVGALLALARETVPAAEGRFLMWQFHARRIAGRGLWPMARRARNMLRAAGAMR